MSRINTVVQVIKQKMPTQFASAKYGYTPTVGDLYCLFDIVNEYVFRERLDKQKLEINLVDFTSQKDKGQFALGKEDLSKCVINIVCHPYGDNFQLIASVFCHEMLHMYDLYFGQLKNHLTKVRENVYQMDVKKINGHQYINMYDVHGKYFDNMIATFRKFGIIVKKSYNINDTKFFMKENENDDGFVFFKDDSLNETDEISSDSIEMKFVDTAAKSLGKNYKFIDDDHWYIRID